MQTAVDLNFPGEPKECMFVFLTEQDYRTWVKSPEVFEQCSDPDGWAYTFGIDHLGLWPEEREAEWSIDSYNPFVKEYEGPIGGPDTFPAIVYFVSDKGWDRAGDFRIKILDWLSGDALVESGLISVTT